MANIINEKQAMRESVLAVRAALMPEQVMAASAAIMGRIMALDGYKDSKTVLCYLDFKNEVLTGALITNALNAGKTVLAPIIVKGKDGIKTMEVSRITGIKNLVPKVMGIREPENPWIANPESIDFFIVPGIAYDVHGNRLGFGGGFIDRFLPRLRKDCVTAAPAYDFQVFERIPAGKNDHPVQLIVTEKRIILPAVPADGSGKGREDSLALPAETENT